MTPTPLIARVIVALLVASGGCACAAPARIALKAQAESATRVLRLGDIAEVSCADAAAAQALATLVVGQLGSAAAPSRFERAELARYAARHLPPGVAGVEWSGADAVSVQLRTVRIEPDRLVARAAADLRAHLQANYTDVEVLPAGRIEALRLPAGELALATHLAAAGALQPNRHMRVDVDLLIDGERLRTVPLWFDVRAHADGWTVVKDLPAGHVLTPDDVARARVDVAALNGAAPPSAELVGLRLRRTLHAGTALSAAALEDTPLVARGDDVTLELRSGGVVVESRATALGDGRAGQEVRVRVTGSETLRGRVIGAGRLAL
ncbi:MAG TPA: flagellar basal body P-ring formation chaperone FlgA [Burkholderiaceae bacterium]|nr:flagellar basal body P-ring formation chaperone FlgA [Burkholderiaceae bacterium]